MKTSDGIKILITTSLYPPDIGGPATYVAMLNDRLPAYNISIRTLVFGRFTKYPKVIRHLLYFIQSLSAARGCKLIFAQDPVSVGVPSMLAAALMRKPFVVKIVGDYAWEQGVQRFGVTCSLDEFWSKQHKFPVPLFKRVEQTVAKRACYIITPSNYLKKIIVGWGIDQQKIVVIENAFSESPLMPQKDTLRKKLNLTGFIIISSGRLVPWKGFRTLITVIRDLRRKIPDIRLIIAGSGPDEVALKALISKLSLERDVYLVGQLQRMELLEHIYASDVFVLNTGYEGFSHQLLEVMMIGTPIVTTDVGGNPEIIENGKEGILVGYNESGEILNAITDIFHKRDWGMSLARNAAKKVQIFEKDTMIKKTVNVFYECLNA